MPAAQCQTCFFYAGCYGVWNIVKLENILILHLQSFDNISHFLFNSSPDEQMTHLVKKKYRILLAEFT